MFRTVTHLQLPSNYLTKNFTDKNVQNVEQWSATTGSVRTYARNTYNIDFHIDFWFGLKKM